MKGVVTNIWSNGLVWISGEDGKDYLTHLKESLGEIKLKTGRKVTFDAEPPREGGKYCRAVNVQRDGEWFHGDGAANGTWVLCPRETTVVCAIFCRCSACGSTNEHPSKYCPHCGALMEKGEGVLEKAQKYYPKGWNHVSKREYREILKNEIRRDA